MASPRRWRSTFIRPAPSRSPDSSVATRKIFRPTRRPRFCNWLLITASRRHAGHKQSGTIGRLDHVLWLGEKRVAGSNRNSRESGARSPFDRARTDRRQVEAQILAALGLLDEDASTRGRPYPTPFPQGGDPREKAVGALDVFDPDHMPVDHDHGLSDIKRPERAQHLAPSGDIRRRGLVRLGAGQTSLGHQQIGRDILQPHHPKSIPLENAADSGEQVIVAAAKGVPYVRDDAQRAEVDADL